MLTREYISDTNFAYLYIKMFILMPLLPSRLSGGDYLENGTTDHYEHEKSEKPGIDGNSLLLYDSVSPLSYFLGILVGLMGSLSVNHLGYSLYVLSM